MCMLYLCMAYAPEQRPRTILHVDMNAFFASVEQADNPALRDKPSAVIGDKNHTVVPTASPSAKACGVKTGATLGEARKRCPAVQFVVRHPQRCMDTSRGVLAVLPLREPVRLVGVSVANVRPRGEQLPYFPLERRPRLLRGTGITDAGDNVAGLERPDCCRQRPSATDYCTPTTRFTTDCLR